MDQKVKQFEQLFTEIFACQKCKLHETANKKVVCRGNLDASLLLVGEAPGKEEDQTGVPFVGRAGQILGILLSYADFPTNSYFICNTICCRPPNNRMPTPEEKLACRPFLERFINLVDPVVIVPLGKTATTSVFDYYDIKLNSQSMTALRGVSKRTSTEKIVFPVYHPAALLYNSALFDIAKKDFLQLREIVDRVIR